MAVKKIILTIALIINPLIAAIAQYNGNDTIQQYDSIVGFLPESLDDDMNKLLQSWHVKHFSKVEDFCLDEAEDPYFPDSVYEQRMKRLPFLVPMTYNKIVRKCIDLYSVRLRNKVRYIMGMADFYFPMMEQKLDANGLPVELKYLAVVESALDPFAQSRVGAYGLWQFMLPTGKIYGLEINSLIDERLDPEKATDAACRYFKEMYDLYGDWLLVIASYNCGPGNVNKAIHRAGGKTDFWKIFQYLPRETRSYVPLFMAAAYIMTYHCEHDMCPIRANFSVATDTIMVEKSLEFKQIANILNMDIDAIRFYNPQYKREIIPGNIRPSILRLPIEETFAFFDNKDSIYARNAEELLANYTPESSDQPSDNKEKITHIVKSGETVYTIANKYGVTSRNLRRWNRIRGSRVAKGKRLTIYIDNGGLAYAAKETGQTTQESIKTKQKSKPKTTKPKYISYKVKSGDTLSQIARKYPNVTAKQIQRTNNMRNTKIRIGQILKIPQG